MATTYKAPGKVLILGGYAILERPNPGLVLEVDTYFRCVANWEEDNSDLPDGCVRVKVESRQWGNWRGNYLFDLKNGLVPDAESKERNSYVEKPLAWALYCAYSHEPGKSMPKGKMLALSLFADNDFYSQQENLQKHGLKRTAEGLRALPLFSDVVNKAAKTGLGSSAAMISALVGAVLGHVFGYLDKELAHRIAQLCHAAVQGKIGSGFDVCCAYYGSMRYVRYDPNPLNSSLSAMSNASSTFAQSGEALLHCVKHGSWNHEMVPFRLPKGMELVCADVAGGSETPSMSKKILDWKAKSDGEFWAKLLHRNENAMQALKALSQAEEEDPEAFAEKLDDFSRMKSKDWSGTDTISFRFIECHKAFIEVRESLRIMGELADVPVEPKEQQVLCDSSVDMVPGVLCCGVPGAGGYDAVFAIVLGPRPASDLEKYWEKYTDNGLGNVCALMLRQGHSHGIAEDESFQLPISSAKSPAKKTKVDS